MLPLLSRRLTLQEEVCPPRTRPTFHPRLSSPPAPGLSPSGTGENKGPLRTWRLRRLGASCPWQALTLGEALGHRRTHSPPQSRMKHALPLWICERRVSPSLTQSPGFHGSAATLMGGDCAGQHGCRNSPPHSVLGDSTVPYIFTVLFLLREHTTKLITPKSPHAPSQKQLLF